MDCQGPIQKFEWWQCPLVLAKEQDTESPTVEMISLKSQVSFYGQNNEQFQFQLFPQLQQDLLFEEQTGFNWHKSWLIPSINLKTNLSRFNISRECPLRCYVTSCYPVKQFGKNFLREVKLQGETQRPFVGQSVLLNNLKFTTTSFKINGKKLSLLIVITVQQTGLILSSVISSPIYIDSRKEARLKKTTTIQKIDPQKFLEPLYIFSNLQKVKVDNGLDGFISYYTASNIRFKFKHPFYVCYKFNKCFSLFYNRNKIKDNDQESIIQKIWQAIQKQENNVVMILCTYINFQAKKKTLAIFSNWRMTFIQFVFGKEQIPEIYQQIDSKILPSAYKNCCNKKTPKIKGKTKNQQSAHASYQGPMQNYYRSEITLNGVVETTQSQLS